MIALELTFPAGRFHATPWGRHVNEGAVEWPPSPWRLLRALVATWKRKANDLADDATMQRILSALSEPPEFHLPPATFGHTRHYMPWFKKGPGDKTLVFDSFVAVGKRDPIHVIWPNVHLENPEREVLQQLLPLLGTLGRAESWCEGKLLDSTAAEEAAEHINSRPLEASSQNTDVVSLLGVDAATAFANDHNPRTEKTSGRGKNKTTTVTVLYDPDWHLCMETLWLHDQRYSLPPGAKWVDYGRNRNALAPPKPKYQPPPRPRMEVARFALDSTVLPLVTDTLRIAEAARFILMGIFGHQNKEAQEKGRSDIFSGKQADGTPLQGHQHCYFLPTSEEHDNQARGRIDRLTLYAAGGFEKEELRAIDKLRQIRTKDTEDSGHPLRAILLGCGQSSEFQPGPMKPSRYWISATPFLSPRYPKTRGSHKNTVQGGNDIGAFLSAQLNEELTRWIERNNAPVHIGDVKITLMRDPDGNSRRWCPRKKQWMERSIQFRRFRRKRNDDGGKRPSAFFKLEFPAEVPGPIALGHSSHFGLGLFVPVYEDQLPQK